MEFFKENIYNSKTENRTGKYILDKLYRIGFNDRVGCILTTEGQIPLSFSLTKFTEFLNHRYNMQDYLNHNIKKKDVFKKVRDEIIEINLEYANVLDMDNEQFSYFYKSKDHPVDFYHYEIVITEEAYAEISLERLLMDGGKE
jgi:hypothetical protein